MNCYLRDLEAIAEQEHSVTVLETGLKRLQRPSITSTSNGRQRWRSRSRRSFCSCMEFALGLLDTCGWGKTCLRKTEGLMNDSRQMLCWLRNEHAFHRLRDIVITINMIENLGAQPFQSSRKWLRIALVSACLRLPCLKKERSRRGRVSGRSYSRVGTFAESIGTVVAFGLCCFHKFVAMLVSITDTWKHQTAVSAMRAKT